MAYDVRRAVLVAVLLADPGREWATSELAALLGATKDQVRKDIDAVSDVLPLAQDTITRDGNPVNLFSMWPRAVVDFLGLGVSARPVQ